jgi:hypothetical protein
LIEGGGKGSAGPRSTGYGAIAATILAEKVDINKPFLYDRRLLYTKDVDLLSTYK